MMRSSVERDALWVPGAVALVRVRAKGMLVREVNVRPPGAIVDVDVAVESERGFWDECGGIFVILY